LIYLALVLQFNSMTKPLVVFAGVPFGLMSFCCGSDFGAVEGRTGLNKKDASLSFG